MIIFRCGCGWNLYEENKIPKYNSKEHVFVIACHNSSDVIKSTLKSLLLKVKPESIYVADNGSTVKEQRLTNDYCIQLSKEYYKKRFTKSKMINYGHAKIGSKTIAQYVTICNLEDHVKYVTCIDDDTRLHETWEVNKVIHYFETDSNIGVLAYPLKAEAPQYDIEFFQSLEYLIVGYVKICHAKFYSTIFNSGAFGTYRKEILRESFQYHNCDFNGDDLQICLHMHQLKNKPYLTGEREIEENKIHEINYRVMTATNMIVSTIVPKCWIHLKSVSRQLFPSQACDCLNPDLFGQRSKGWFVSKHRFIPKYLKFIFNCNGWKGVWVRIITTYDLFIIVTEYFLPFYIIFFMHYLNIWILEGFIIGTAFNVFVMLLFNYFILKPNRLNLPIEAITIQPIIYKIFMITFYRYMGLLYNLFIYTPTHKSGKEIRKRMQEQELPNIINTMYDEESIKKAQESEREEFDGRERFNSFKRQKTAALENEMTQEMIRQLNDPELHNRSYTYIRNVYRANTNAYGFNFNNTQNMNENDDNKQDEKEEKEEEEEEEEEEESQQIKYIKLKPAKVGDKYVRMKDFNR